jgi:hypothetical protein
LHGYVRAAVLEGVADKVRDDLLQPAAVAFDDRAATVNAHAICPAPGMDGRFHQGGQVDGLESHGSLARVKAGDLHQVFDQAAEASDIGDDELGRAASLGRHLLEMLREERGLAHQRRDRRPELMGDVGGESPLARLRQREGCDLPFEGLGHLVEGRRPRPELVPPARWQASRQEPLCERPRSSARLGDRSKRSPGDERPDASGHQHEQGEADEQDRPELFELAEELRL